MHVDSFSDAGEILIAGVDGTREALKCYEADVGQETLGVMQAMDGKNSADILHLGNKAAAFAESMRTGFLSKTDAWFALTATILKTMQYPMATTTMKESEWNQIIAHILHAGLPLAGIDNFPRDILYGPACFQGFGILHPWYDQEITHLLICLKQTQMGGITGCLISASMEQLRLEVGLPGWLTDYDLSIFYVLATSSWIATVWEFASRFKIEIHDSEAKLFRRRTNGLYLMEEFVSANFRGPDLVSLSICRKILHSVTLADICTVDRKAITLDAWQGRKDHSSGTEYSWPRVQRKLPSHYWKLWQKALRLCFLVRGSSRDLCERMG
jgi:hypothetical protein